MTPLELHVRSRLPSVAFLGFCQCISCSGLCELCLTSALSCKVQGLFMQFHLHKGRKTKNNPGLKVNNPSSSEDKCLPRFCVFCHSLCKRFMGPPAGAVEVDVWKIDVSTVEKNVRGGGGAPKGQFRVVGYMSPPFFPSSTAAGSRGCLE